MKTRSQIAVMVATGLVIVVLFRGSDLWFSDRAVERKGKGAGAQRCREVVIWVDIDVSIPMTRRIEMTFLAKFRVEHAKAMCLAVVALALLTSGCTSKSTSAD